MTPHSSTKSTVWFFIGFGIAFLGVFDLPWQIPFPGPVKGASYSYGFYNPAAVPALVLALIPILLGLFSGGKNPVALSWFVPAPVLLPPWRKASVEYLILAVASVFCAAAILAWNTYLAVPYWGESSYFLSNIDLVRLGYRPYSDFAFSYGPAFLYGPIALDRLSGGSLGIENAYAACLVLAFALGFFLLFVFQRFLNLPDRDRPWILALTFLVWFQMTLGLQYTPLRFALAPCLLAVGNHPSLYRTPGLVAALRLAALVTLFTSLCFLVSPEMGIACSTGFAASAAVHFLARRIAFALGTLSGIGVTAALLNGFSAHYLHTLSSMGRGAFCFPIFPNYANLILLLVVLFLLPMLAFSILKQPAEPAAPLAAAIGSVAIALLPGALGRCDPGHVMINGLVLFTLLFAALARIKRSYLIGWGAVFALAFVGLAQVSYWNFYTREWRGGIRLHEFYAKHPERVAAWAEDWKKAGAGSPNYAAFNWHKVMPFFDLASSLSKERITAPLGSDPVLDRFLKVRPGFFPPYYCRVTPELFTPDDVARLIDESRTHFDFILIPNEDLSKIAGKIQHPPDGSELQNEISGLMLYPVRNRFRNDAYIPEVQVALALLPISAIVRKDGTFTLIKLAK